MAIATRYEVVVGLEVHAQVLTQSKMFCGCSTDYLVAPPNANTCPVCLGMPGSLPVINRRAVEATIRTALALNCEIPEFSKFDRKNYFYPDLPKGYQISQYDLPFSRHGHLNFDVNGDARRCGITRVHLEEDTGKLQHEGAIEQAQSSLVNFNRAGVPLMEIVSEPDLRSADEAREYVMRLRAILQYIGVNNGDMESGQLRCDANVSLRPFGQAEFGTKVEVKNMNSFRAIHRAIEFEIGRQTEVLDTGGRLIQETRGWNDARGLTVSQRTKEFAEDYRYFPEPDLPPLEVSREWVAEIRSSLPELPAARRDRFITAYGLTPDVVEPDGRLLRGTRPAGGSRQVGHELDPQRLQPAAQCRPQGDRTVVDQACPPAAADRTDRVGHDQRQDGEGDLRGDVPGIRSGAGARGVEGLEPDQRRRRAGGDRRPGDRRKCQIRRRLQGWKGAGPEVPDRPGDEDLQRTGQPAAARGVAPRENQV